MYIGLKHLHSFLPYIFIITALYLVVVSLIRWKRRNAYTKTDGLFRTIVLTIAHIQLLVGLILYFISPVTQSAFADFGAAMKDSTLRLYAVEHISINIVAITLMTIGSAKAKREIIEFKKHKLIFIFFGIGLVLILSRIPWHVWPNL